MNGQTSGNTIDIHVPVVLVCRTVCRYVSMQGRYRKTKFTCNGLLIVHEVILIQSVLDKHSSIDETICGPRVVAIAWGRLRIS
jgi:hypothetical protein